MFFVVDPKQPEYRLVRNVVASQSYVAEFELRDYPVREEDVLMRGPGAWDAALNTVNVGKYNLGWASIGICTHAMYEAIRHAANRRLYGMAVTDFPHVRRMFTDAFARLLAMKLFARRASDYFRSATREDRRYLLFNPVVKMKVTTEGEKVIDLLWDVIAAKGFEKDTYFEMAARDIRALPKLEGTVHVNIALIVKFMRNYFFAPAALPAVPRRDDPADDVFFWDQGPAKGLGKVRFHDPGPVFASWDTPNVALFREQVAVFREMLMRATPTEEQARDVDFLLAVGEIFTLVVLRPARAGGRNAVGGRGHRPRRRGPGVRRVRARLLAARARPAHEAAGDAPADGLRPADGQEARRRRGAQRPRLARGARAARCLRDDAVDPKLTSVGVWHSPSAFTRSASADWP